MTCPKCQNQMQQFSRSGLTVEQCSSCKGVFLDHGELDHLVRAEGAFYEQQQSHQPPPMPGSPMGGRHRDHDDDDDDDDDDRHRSHDRDRHSSHSSKKRKSFMSELFDV